MFFNGCLEESADPMTDVMPFQFGSGVIYCKKGVQFFFSLIHKCRMLILVCTPIKLYMFTCLFT